MFRRNARVLQNHIAGGAAAYHKPRLRELQLCANKGRRLTHEFHRLHRRRPKRHRTLGRLRCGRRATGRRCGNGCGSRRRRGRSGRRRCRRRCAARPLNHRLGLNRQRARGRTARLRRCRSCDGGRGRQAVQRRENAFDVFCVQHCGPCARRRDAGRDRRRFRRGKLSRHGCWSARGRRQRRARPSRWERERGPLLLELQQVVTDAVGLARRDTGRPMNLALRTLDAVTREVLQRVTARRAHQACMMARDILVGQSDGVSLAATNRDLGTEKGNNGSILLAINEEQLQHGLPRQGFGKRCLSRSRAHPQPTLPALALP